MSDTTTLERAPPRRRDAQATRAAILEAAKGQFALQGYDRAALRDIAAEAGADVSLIKRYFGGKEALFTEALKASIRSDRLRDWDRVNFPRDVAQMMAGAPDEKHGKADDGRAHGFEFLLRAATSPTTAPLLNVAVQERFLGPIADWLGVRRRPGPRPGAGRRLHRLPGRTPDPRRTAAGPGARGVHRAGDSDVRGADFGITGQTLTPHPPTMLAHRGPLPLPTGEVFKRLSPLAFSPLPEGEGGARAAGVGR